MTFSVFFLPKFLATINYRYAIQSDLKLLTDLEKMNNFFQKTAQLGVGSAIIGLAVIATPAAEAFQITTATRGSYDVEITLGSWDDNPDLTSTPWFGDLDLATEIADALFADYAAFEENQDWLCSEACNTLIGWGLSDEETEMISTVGVRKFMIQSNAFSPKGVNGNTNLEGGILGRTSGFYWLTGEEVEAVPTPAAVLPGLLSMSLSAIRKRKDTSSEDI